MKTRMLVLSGLLVLSLFGCASSGATGASNSSSTGESDTANDAAGDSATEAPSIPECTGFVFDEGGEVSGDVVANCVRASTLANNFGKMTVENDEFDGLSTFRYRPEFAATVDMQGDELLFIEGDDMWFKDELGWVQAVDDNSNFRGKLAFTVGSLYRGLSDPRAAVDMISSAPLWNIVGEEDIERPDGDARSAWKISAAAPFSYLGIQITELSFWFDRGYTVLQQHAVSSALGETATTLNRYYDWGKEVKFVAPVEQG